MKRNTNYVLGADFGSDSVRVVVIDALTVRWLAQESQTISGGAKGNTVTPN